MWAASRGLYLVLCSDASRHMLVASLPVHGPSPAIHGSLPAATHLPCPSPPLTRPCSPIWMVATRMQAQGRSAKPAAAVDGEVVQVAPSKPGMLAGGWQEALCVASEGRTTGLVVL